MLLLYRRIHHYISLYISPQRTHSNNTNITTTITLFTDVQMIHGDFLKLRTKDWRDADVVFMNSTCFDESLMSKVAVIASKSRKEQ